MSAQPEQRKTLLSIIEIGGYPNYTPLYEKLGFNVVSARSVRKAISLMKQIRPAAIVAEFNFQSDFRDRTSSLESLLAVVQRMPETKVVVFYEQEFDHQFARLKSNFPIYMALTYPVDRDKLETGLRRIAED